MLKYVLLFLFISCSPKSPKKLSLEELLEPQITDLAYIIAAECMQCDSIERQDVGAVIINRLHHPDYPKSIYEIIRQKNAFKGYCAEQYVYDPACWDIATYLILGGKRDTRPIFFWLKKGKKPKYVKKVLFSRKFHSFGI